MREEGRAGQDNELGHRQEWNTNHSRAENSTCVDPFLSLSINDIGGAACDEARDAVRRRHMIGARLIAPLQAAVKSGGSGKMA